MAYLNDDAPFKFSIDCLCIKVEDKDKIEWLATPASYDDLSVFNQVELYKKDENYTFVYDRETDGCVGVIDNNGNLTVSFDPSVYNDFTFASFFVGDYAIVADEKYNHGLIDPYGNIVIPIIYKSLGYYLDGVIAAKTGDLWGYLDIGGNWVISPKYTYAREFYNGIAIVEIEEKPIIIDKGNSLAAPDIFYWSLSFPDDESILSIDPELLFFCRTYTWVEMDGKVGLLVKVGDDSYGIMKPPGVADYAALTANPTASTVYVNGEPVAFDAYNINDNNYFKLRDIAYILNGTGKQFSVGWDGAANAISLTSDEIYIAVGGEMEGKGGSVKTPMPTDSKILLNGTEVSFTAYNIDGNNYFKLRDIGAAFGFAVEWDGENNAIKIDTSKGYTE